MEGVYIRSGEQKLTTLTPVWDGAAGQWRAGMWVRDSSAGVGTLTFADEELGKLVNYAQRKLDEDTRNATYQDYSAQVISVYTEVSSATSWFAPEILKLDDEQIERFYVSCPDLDLYRRALDVVFHQRGHILGDAEEQLLARAQDMAMQPERIFSLFNDADLKFEDATDSDGETHPVTHGSYVPLMMSDDRELRKSAYTTMYSAYEQFRNNPAAT